MGLFRADTRDEAAAKAARRAEQAAIEARQRPSSGAAGSALAGERTVDEVGGVGPSTAEGNTESFANPLGPDLRGKVPPPHPGVPDDLSFNDDLATGEVAQQDAANTMFPKMAQRRGDPGVVQGEGENFLPTRGKNLFDETYVAGPQRLAEAQSEVGRLQGNKSEALSAKYGQETQRAQEAMAANQVRRQADDQEIAVRQKNLEQATQHYTNDLRDQGKFWNSPGNIVSAIAFSLMPIFSNDPTIGVKLINQAIDRDMTNRKDLANMHLGELRSNVGMYRKLADDRNVGDQLAQAEAHRVAAMDIERISQQFDSPISKAKAKAMVEDQLMRAGQVQMTAYNHFNYNTVRKLDARVAKAFEAPGKAGNTDAWKSFVIPAGTPGANVVGNVAGTPSTATDTGGGRLSGMNQTQAVALAHSPDQLANMALDGKIQGKDLQLMYRNAIVARANSIVDQSSPHYELEFNKKVDELQHQAEEGVAQIAEKAQPLQTQIAVTTRLARDMAVIKAECTQAGIPLNDFLGEMRGGIGGPLSNKINDLRIRFNNDHTDSASQREAMERLKASERFHQAVAGKIINYYHGMAGAAQNETESRNLAQVISTTASWDKLEGFIHAEAQNYAKEYRNVLRNSKSPYAATLYVANNGNGTPALPYQGIAAPTTRNPLYNGPDAPQRGTPTPLARQSRGPAPVPTQDEFAP